MNRFEELANAVNEDFIGGEKLRASFLADIESILRALAAADEAMPAYDAREDGLYLDESGYLVLRDDALKAVAIIAASKAKS